MRRTPIHDMKPGFSLIEVLIAVLVLAIGLLGLGAVFPAIIAEQRSAFEVVEGENVAGAAASLLTSGELVDFSYIEDSFNMGSEGANQRYQYVWVVPSYEPDAFAWNTQVPDFEPFTGLWSYQSVNPNPGLPTADRYLTQIPVSARLYPQPYSGKDPKYVWDLALRREPSGNRVQAAIFVRRVDARLRVPKGYSLSDVLTGSGGVPNGQLLPVAIDAGSGLPVADNGANNLFYAAVQSLNVEVHPTHLDWMIFPDGRDPMVDTSVGFATRVGQKLLDNTGVVRTVVETPRVDDGDPLASYIRSRRAVVVDPPFTSQNAGGANTDSARPGSNSTNPVFDDERASWVRQVIFTPRTPVAIRVVTLEDSR